jgi:hypothetical protein
MNLFERSFHLSQFVFPKGGTCLEFGVFRGGTFAYQAEQIINLYPKTSLIGFDSWEGLPPETEGIWTAPRHAPGEYAAPKTETLSKLAALGISNDDQRFRLVDGFYSESLTPAVASSCGPLAFVNIDVDIHSSTLELLDFIAPMLRPGVIVYWDDWKDPRDRAESSWGEHHAWAEWSARQNGLSVETIEVNPVEQRTMLVTAANGKTMDSRLPSVQDIRYRALELYLDPSEPKRPSDAILLKQIAKRQLSRLAKGRARR